MGTGGAPQEGYGMWGGTPKGLWGMGGAEQKGYGDRGQHKRVMGLEGGTIRRLWGEVGHPKRVMGSGGAPREGYGVWGGAQQKGLWDVGGTTGGL